MSPQSNLVFFICQRYYGLHEGENRGIPLNQVNIHGLMFADNVVLVAESQKKLQDLFNELSIYCREWKLELNAEKTKLVVFGSSADQWNVFQYYYTMQAIEIAGCFRYLGFTISSSRGFTQDVPHNRLKALRALMTRA